tara:strand:- start:369 stop:1151 length:783 start_codon:yes stop_codon:yes gene_type:complete
MITKLKNFLRPLLLSASQLGFDFGKIKFFKYYLRYRNERKEWINKGGTINKQSMILYDYDASAGNNKGHYFHQDLLVAKLIHEHQPKRHIDVGSRIDGFVAHVASFREIEVIDFRPLKKSCHENIKFIQSDLMHPHDLGKVDSISCLHAIEHFGLGRYGDPIDINGHNKGITNLVNMLSKNGLLYISFPIGCKDEIHFNANRVFRVDTIFKHPSILKKMELIRFDYVDQSGNLHNKANIKDLNTNANDNCGIYLFKKIND